MCNVCRWFSVSAVAVAAAGTTFNGKAAGQIYAPTYRCRRRPPERTHPFSVPSRFSSQNMFDWLRDACAPLKVRACRRFVHAAAAAAGADDVSMPCAAYVMRPMNDYVTAACASAVAGTFSVSACFASCVHVMAICMRASNEPHSVYAMYAPPHARVFCLFAPCRGDFIVACVCDRSRFHDMRGRAQINALMLSSWHARPFRKQSPASVLSIAFAPAKQYPEFHAETLPPMLSEIIDVDERRRHATTLARITIMQSVPAGTAFKQQHDTRALAHAVKLAQQPALLAAAPRALVRPDKDIAPAAKTHAAIKAEHKFAGTRQATATE